MDPERVPTTDGPGSLPAELRQRLDAAWREHAVKAADQLFGAWREEMENLLARYFASHHLRTEEWNQAVRGLRFAASHQDWVGTLLEAATWFCSGAALFSTLNQRLRCEGVRGIDENLSGLDIPLPAAPAFASVVDTADPVAALATAGELSESVWMAARPGACDVAHLFPINCGGKVQAVLYTQGVGHPSALELLASIGASTLESRAAAAVAGLVAITPAAREPTRPWEALPKEERQLHLRAQRLARVRASEIRLARADAVASGRKQGDLYGALRDEIEGARAEFQRQFMDASPNMVDYLHIELVRTLANDDHALLGPDYPGPLA
jgi:hypothetical protein